MRLQGDETINAQLTTSSCDMNLSIMTTASSSLRNLSNSSSLHRNKPTHNYALHKEDMNLISLIPGKVSGIWYLKEAEDDDEKLLDERKAGLAQGDVDGWSTDSDGTGEGTEAYV